jgi:hypothetical protein
MYTVEMASGGMIILPRFMKIDAGVQTILRFCFCNWNDCNGGTTEGKQL